jgi:ABC-type lipoprotein export system ATPase subunit
MLVSLRQIRKEFGGVRALDGIDLELGPGFTVLTGASGAGKTTLLQIAGGLLAPDAGEVRFDDRQPWNGGPSARAAFRRRHVGFVFQHGQLLPALDLRDNVALPLLLEGAADARERAERALAAMDLGARSGHWPEMLSGGELQRAALARALIHSPAVVLADEPTGNLDPDLGVVVLQALVAAAARGATVLVATHDARAMPAAGRVLRLCGGRLA